MPPTAVMSVSYVRAHMYVCHTYVYTPVTVGFRCVESPIESKN